jgi:hypothetical protein
MDIEHTTSFYCLCARPSGLGLGSAGDNFMPGRPIY